MLRPLNPRDYADDPVVGSTVRRLRLSIVAVVVGVAVSAMFAATIAGLAYRDGFRAAATPAQGKAHVAARKARPTSKQAPAKATRGTAAARAKRAGHATRGTKQRTTSTRRAGTRTAPAGRTTAQAGAKTTPPRAITGGPGTGTWVLLAGGFTVIGLLLFYAVRRPYASARYSSAELVRAYRNLEAGTLETFAALNATVEAKDRYTAGHGLRVTLISMLIAQEMDLPQAELDMLRHAATFHDIGKIAVPDNVLQKPGRLTDQEFEAMKVHPVESARICSKVAALKDAIPSIRGHHERLDGRGYPDGLTGMKIPLGARIIAVADTWDAITSDRPYRRGQPATVALDEIRRVSGTQFDERVVDAFLEVLAKDPWMFGLTPEDVRRRPVAAPGMKIDTVSRASENARPPLVEAASDDADQRANSGEIDWADGFDEEDLAA